MRDQFDDWAARNPEWAMDDDEVAVPPPLHPGPLLRDEVLAPRGITGAGLARMLGTPQPTVSRLLSGQMAFTPAMAVRVERATGYSADLLMRLQVSYDVARARAELPQAA